MRSPGDCGPVLPARHDLFGGDHILQARCNRARTLSQRRNPVSPRDAHEPAGALRTGFYLGLGSGHTWRYIREVNRYRTKSRNSAFARIYRSHPPAMTSDSANRASLTNPAELPTQLLIGVQDHPETLRSRAASAMVIRASRAQTRSSVACALRVRFNDAIWAA